MPKPGRDVTLEPAWEVPIFVTAGEAITHTSEPLGRGEDSVLFGTPQLGAPPSDLDMGWAVMSS